MVTPPHNNLPPGRLVVLLCGPPGAGKTTTAHKPGLTVYDRDDPACQGEKHFTETISRLAHDPFARAVVIRTAATSTARAKAQALTNATHCYLLTAHPDELARRVTKRGRHDTQRCLAGITSWFNDHDMNDGITEFPGWHNLGEPLNTAPQPHTTWKW